MLNKVSLTIVMLLPWATSAMFSRRTHLPANNVHRMGWGLDDDVYFDTFNQVPDILSEEDVKSTKPVKRVVKKVEKLKDEDDELVAHHGIRFFGMTHDYELEDLLGLE